MNLIEQLGGYEKALDLFRGCPWDSGTVDVPSPRSKGMFRLDLSDLSYELLEYRRQHNIFEVGDKVLTDDEFINVDGSLYQDSYRIDEVLSIESVGGHGFGLSGSILADTVKHATDAEIKAGKRL